MLYCDGILVEQKKANYMQMSVQRKVEEIRLKQNEFLLPLFEVIINAIQSIHEKGENKGSITIEVKRDKSLIHLIEDDQAFPYPINDFIVVDNGIGFNTKNFNSFGTAYSVHKMNIGGKGVGRFTVLAAFKEMCITSSFKENDKSYVRDFSFSAEKELDPVDGGLKENIGNNKTTIHLKNYHNGLKEKTRIPKEVLAEKIVEHCLMFYILRSAPKIYLKDEDDDKYIDLDDVFKNYAHVEFPSIEFLEGKEKFQIHIAKRYNSTKHHRIHFCAHDRDVYSYLLRKIDSGYSVPFSDDRDKYFLSVYVTGTYLDKRVNTLRNSFDIADSSEAKGLFEEFSWTEIENLICSKLNEKYSDQLEGLNRKREEKVYEYVFNDKNPRPQYRHAIKDKEVLKEIPYDANDDDIEEILHKISFRKEKETTKRFEKLLSKKRIDDYEEFTNSIREALQEENEVNKDRLAEYVIRRRFVISFFRKFLSWDEKKKYKLEGELHNLIFPMGETNDSIPFSFHNLWLLDEKLTFHTYVNSDTKINKATDGNSLKEPDLLIFDMPWAYTDDINEMKSSVIFEFKRPGRTFSGSERAVDRQVRDYFEQLEGNKVKDYRGQFVSIDKNTPKFGYIICEVDNDMKGYLLRDGYSVTNSGTLYRSIGDYNLYLEIMTYQQLLNNAEKRHHAFFKQLGVNL